jgi:hypothetical protein
MKYAPSSISGRAIENPHGGNGARVRTRAAGRFFQIDKSGHQVLRLPVAPRLDVIDQLIGEELHRAA